MTKKEDQLSPDNREELLQTLQNRFEKNLDRFGSINWSDVQAKIEAEPGKLWSLHEMERTGGEPDLVEFDKEKNEFIFYDCSAETPKGRRSLCYDRQALDARKKFKPENSAIDAAQSMGIEILTEEQYRQLQTRGSFDKKTSSWIQTPAEIRELGGALFCDFRYGQVFVYHNGADSYYASRGFRGLLRV